jgi:hypothetical protein
MGQFFNSRDWLRTPTFVDKDLYEPLPDSAQFDDAPLPSREMRQEMPSAPLPPPPPTQPMREYDEPSADPGPQQTRQRITLEAAPLPPKPGLMRKIIGMAAGAYMPQVGREIMAPGYDRQMREYNANKQRMMDEGKLNYQQAQEDAQVAAARAAMARAEESNAKKQRTMGQMASDGGFNLGPNQVRFDRNGNRVASNPLPPQPTAPGLKVSRARAEAMGLYVPEGADSVEIPVQGAAAALNSTPRPSRGVSEIAEIVARKMPNATQEEQDAEVVRLWSEEKKLKAEKEKALTNRANRVPTGRTGGAAGTATENAEARRSIDEMAKAQIAEAGDVDKAIANMNAWPSRDATAEKVLLHLKALKGGKALGGGKGKGDAVAAIAAKFGVGGTPATPAPTPKPVDKNKDPLGVR